MTKNNEKTQPILHCTFCSKSQNDVHRLIASSPSVVICDECVEKCSAILKPGSDLNSPDAYQVLQSKIASSDEGFWLWRRIRNSFSEYIRCSFCHQRQIDVERMIAKNQAYVCEKCVVAMLNLLNEEEQN